MSSETRLTGESKTYLLQVESRKLQERLEEAVLSLAHALDVLEGMVEQHCVWPGAGEIHHQFIGANEKAFAVLVAAGRLRRVEGPSERYEWVEERE